MMTQIFSQSQNHL